MNEEDSFIVGQVYFEVKYPDEALKYPLIESFVFIGKNVLDEDTDETQVWYFQPAKSFAKQGSVLETRKGDRQVAGLKKHELAEMFDEERLFQKLKAARERRGNQV